MSEVAGGNPEEARQRLILRSMEDETLRRRLLADPKATIEQEMGVKLPEGIEVRAVEETLGVVYLVLPPRAENLQPGGELTDKELEAVAGGWERGGGTGIQTGFTTISCSGDECRAGTG